MESLENLTISFLDVEANKGLFRKELCKVLNINWNDVFDIWLESTLTDGVVCQYIYVTFHCRLSKKALDRLDYEFIDPCGAVVFKAGDIVL